ncbi:hypothetical protein D3C72_2289920 [compost metagenome]
MFSSVFSPLRPLKLLAAIISSGSTFRPAPTSEANISIASALMATVRARLRGVSISITSATTSAIRIGNR